MAFIGLNPSTADETTDDPTIRRCLGFARAWGFGALDVLNLYAWRSTDPVPLWDGSVADPVGPDTDAALISFAQQAELVVAAWGAFPKAQDRARQVRAALEEPGVRLHVLKLTARGAPQHPLYAPGSLIAKPWTT